MKKVRYLIFLLILVVQACSYTDITNLLPATPTLPPTASYTPAVSDTPTRTPTVTPTQPTPTFTSTPTFIYSGPTPTSSITPVFTSTIGLLITLTNTPAPLELAPQSSLFTSIKISGNLVYWGRCEPSSVKVTVHVVDTALIRTVLLELRLVDTKTGERTEWGGGAIMDDDKKGTFTYNLTAQNFEHYREFSRAWGQYQVVAFDSHMARLGASAIYKNSLTIAPCR